MGTLERAIVIATEAHAGQTDKAGAPYILHPLRVMLAQSTIEARIVAVLHDVLEDCPAWTPTRLRAEDSRRIVLDALAAVTKRPEERDNYEAFVRRAATNPIGLLVKVADLRDNIDLTRLPSPTAQDLERVAKYQRALALLERLAPKPV